MRAVQHALPVRRGLWFSCFSIDSPVCLPGGTKTLVYVGGGNGLRRGIPAGSCCRAHSLVAMSHPCETFANLHFLYFISLLSLPATVTIRPSASLCLLFRKNCLIKRKKKLKHAFASLPGPQAWLLLLPGPLFPRRLALHAARLPGRQLRPLLGCSVMWPPPPFLSSRCHLASRSQPRGEGLHVGTSPRPPAQGTQK